MFFLACAPQTISAQEFSFGAQMSLALPMGDAGEKDILNHRPGFGLGLHGLWNFYPGHALVPRIDITLFQRDRNGNDVLAGPFKDSITLKDIKVGVDYNITINNAGLYGIAGAGYSSFEWAIEWPASTNSGLARETKGGLYLSAGAGYVMTKHFIAEVRYSHAAYSGVGSSLGAAGRTFTAPALAVSLLWRY